MNIYWPALLVICATLIAVALVLVLPVPSSRRKASIPADRPRPSVVYREDDRYWFAGVFYNNPDDPEPFVPRRYGFGWTVNFGHPVGKLVLFAILLLGLVVPLVVALFPGFLPSSGCHPSGCHLFP